MDNAKLLTLIVSAMMMCLLLIYSFLHSQKRGVRYFVWVMFFRVVFGCGVILELYSNDVASKLFSANRTDSACDYRSISYSLCVRFIC